MGKVDFSKSRWMAQVVDKCYRVYMNMGPFMLEKAYQQALSFELTKAGIPHEMEKMLPFNYNGEFSIPTAYRIDILVDNEIIIELKAVNELLPVHHAQLTNYMMLSRIPYGILVNFRTPFLKKSLFRASLMEIEEYRSAHNVKGFFNRQTDSTFL